MTRTEGAYTSADKSTQIAYSVYTPDGNPRAVVQLVHGMCEYVDRYQYLAEYLTSHGIVFCGNDCLGHGRTAVGDDDLGYFGGEGSHEYLPEDVRSLYLIMRKKYRRLPYIMLGHSMGSFILRSYISKYGATEDQNGMRLDGAVIAGTSCGDAPVKQGIMLAKLVAKLKGERYRSAKLRGLAFKDYNKRYPSDGQFGWCTRDAAERTRYEGDRLCNFMFTAAGYREMLSLLREVTSEEWAASVPLSLPIMLIGGSDDPVGSYGKAQNVVGEALRDAEVNDVTVKVYDGCRHELFFELEPQRRQVCDDVVEFIDRVIEGVHEARTANAFTGFGGAVDADEKA